MNDLHDLMRLHVSDPPPDHLWMDAILEAGRRRVRRRRAARAGGASLLVAGIVAVAAVTVSGAGDGGGTQVADGPPTPDAPTIRLIDASQAIAGSDFTVLDSYTNKNLDFENGQYFDGTTDDGLVLFRDGPNATVAQTRLALLDPATGKKDWLPTSGIGQKQFWPAELSIDRLVLISYDITGVIGADGATDGTLTASVFDRSTRQWSTLSWPTLPSTGSATAGEVGPDGRLYVSVPAAQGQPPVGGWPKQIDGDAEDADADGDTYSLWSVSLTDPADARDEHVTVGSVAFTPTSMVWTDSTNGSAGRIHVRDLSTDEEISFDPHMGGRCNLLALSATSTRVILSQYCGTYTGEVRDDRVQILTTDGDQVVTLQDDGIGGSLTSSDGRSDLVSVTSYKPGQAGTYLYNLATDQLLRVSDAVSKFAVGGPTSNNLFLFHTPTNHRHGVTQTLAKLTSP